MCSRVYGTTNRSAAGASEGSSPQFSLSRDTPSPHVPGLRLGPLDLPDVRPGLAGGRDPAVSVSRARTCAGS